MEAALFFILFFALPISVWLRAYSEHRNLKNTKKKRRESIKQKKPPSSYSIHLERKKEEYEEMEKSNICVLDIETTGFVPGEAEIIELFILKVKDDQIIDEYYSLFKPEKKITNSHIHGISNNKVRNAPKIKNISKEITDFLEDSVLVGHNIDNFDLKFLNYFLTTPIKNKTIDTLKLSRSILGKKVVDHKLNTLTRHFGVKDPTHSARDDVMSTYEVYKKLNSIK